jgi:hypothetical protein
MRRLSFFLLPLFLLIALVTPLRFAHADAPQTDPLTATVNAIESAVGSFAASVTTPHSPPPLNISAIEDAAQTALNSAATALSTAASQAASAWSTWVALANARLISKVKVAGIPASAAVIVAQTGANAPPIAAPSSSALPTPHPFPSAGASSKQSNRTLPGPPSQPIPFRGSTKPRHHLFPSKIRDTSAPVVEVSSKSGEGYAALHSLCGAVQLDILHQRAPKACDTRYVRNTSMAGDKKDYQYVLGVLVDYGTLPTIINKLNRVLIATEDPDLKKLIEPVLARVDKALRDLPGGKKNVRASLRQQLTVEPFKSVVEYCQKCIGSTKPQWQIIAERHGWGPKSQ